MTELDVTLRDGRTLHVYDDGDPGGEPVVAHHGTPSAGQLYRPHIEDARTHGIRLIGYDRAGYGASTSNPGRTVADVTGDIADALDALGIDRFATWGISGGGPHALACGALLPDRCVAVASLASPAPFDADGLDWLAGQGEGNIAEWNAALAGLDVLEPLLRAEAAQMLAATPNELRDVMLSVLTPVDQGAMTGDFGAYLYATMQRGLAERVDGWRDDDIAFTRPWGFAAEDIQVPVLLWQGVQDLMVPPDHGRWLAARIPGVDAHVSEDDGHLTLVKLRVPEVHAWLLERF
ncbi:MAG TPA: alpha/beta hydrolase [Gaiellaceae bacterium]